MRSATSMQRGDLRHSRNASATTTVTSGTQQRSSGNTTTTFQEHIAELSGTQASSRLAVTRASGAWPRSRNLSNLPIRYPNQADISVEIRNIVERVKTRSLPSDIGAAVVSILQQSAGLRSGDQGTRKPALTDNSDVTRIRFQATCLEKPAAPLVPRSPRRVWHLQLGDSPIRAAANASNSQT